MARHRSYQTERYFLSAIIRRPRFFASMDRTVNLFPHEDTLGIWRRIEEVCFYRGKDPGTERISFAEMAQTRAHQRVSSTPFDEQEYDQLVRFELGGADPHPMYRMLVLYAAQRQLAERVTQALALAEDDPQTLIRAVQNAATSVNVVGDAERVSMAVASERIWAGRGERKRPWVRSGFPTLDAIAGPWMPGQIYGFVARPNHGKGLFANNCAEKQVAAGFGVGILSFEDPAELWAARFLSRRSGVSFTTLRDTLLSGDRLLEEADAVAVELALLDDAGRRVQIVEAEGFTAEDAAHAIREMVHYGGVDVVWIDYLQEMRSIRTIAQELPTQLWHALQLIHAVSREVKIPVAIMSQANRNCEVEHRFPVLSDSEWCGAFDKKVAGGVVLAQPGMFLPRTCKAEGLDAEPNTLVASVQKARMGHKGSVRFFIHPETMALSEERRA